MAAKMSEIKGKVVWDVTETEGREGYYTGSCDHGIVELIPNHEGGIHVRAARDPKAGGVLGSGFMVNRIGYEADAAIKRGGDGRWLATYVSMTRMGAAMREATDSARAAFRLVWEAAHDALLECDPLAFEKAQIRHARELFAGYEKAEFEAKSNAQRMTTNIIRMERAMLKRRDALAAQR
jgi:hypothetical protein